MIAYAATTTWGYPDIATIKLFVHVSVLKKRDTIKYMAYKKKFSQAS